MNPIIPKLILTFALILLLGGVTAGIITTRNRQADLNNQPAQPTATQPVETTQPSETQTQPKTAPTPKNNQQDTLYYTTYEVSEGNYFETSEAWARSGVRSDGTTYAESFAR